MLATHRYKKNPYGPVGNELDLSEGETLVYLMKHDDNDHWWLAENGKGQVGYVPAAYLMIILDETLQEEDSDTRKEGQGKGTDGTKIGGEMGQHGERRKTYSAAVIDGFKRNSTIYVGDSIVRKTDTRLSRGEDVVVCLPGARIEHVTERVEQIMGRGYGGSILVHVGTNNTDKEGTTAIVEKYKNLLKKTKQARAGQIILSGILPVFGNRIDGYRNSKRMAINGMGKRICKEEDVGYLDLWDSFVFSMMGIVSVLKTDNGPPFNSHQFKAFATNMGFKHQRITPICPQANGEAKRFMRNLGKVARSAVIEGRPWRQEMYKCLRNYRATPHSSTGIAPATALFGREMKTKLPATISQPRRVELTMR